MKKDSHSQYEESLQERRIQWFLLLMLAVFIETVWTSYASDVIPGMFYCFEVNVHRENQTDGRIKTKRIRWYLVTMDGCSRF